MLAFSSLKGHPTICLKVLLFIWFSIMVNQSDAYKEILDEAWGSHGCTDNDFVEYSEEEMLIEEESNEILNLPHKGSSDDELVEEIWCEYYSDDEGLCTEGPVEDSDQEPNADTEKSPNQEIFNEEFSQESEELERGFINESLANDHHGLPSSPEKNAVNHISMDSKISANIQCPRELNSFTADAPLASNNKKRSRWDIKGEVATGDLSRRKSRWSTDIHAETIAHVNNNVGHDKRKTRWSTDIHTETTALVNNDAGHDNRRKTRWSTDEAQLSIPSTVEHLDFVKDIFSNACSVERIKKLTAKLLKINKKLESHVVAKEHSQEENYPDSSVMPRLVLLKQKNQIISELLASKKKDESKPIFSKKLYIPLKEHPNYNFLGLILGPKGNTLKKMEKETGAIIVIRGKGSNTKNKNCPHEHDELHVLIESDSQTSLAAAVSMVEKLLVPVNDRQNYHKASQLRELAELKGTLQIGNSWQPNQCNVCGQLNHPTSQCPLTATSNKLETMSGSLFSTLKGSFTPNLPLEGKVCSDKLKKGSDPSNLFVGCLPQSVSSHKLKELFFPYGKLYTAWVMKDKTTGQSKGYGFVKYTLASDAAMAIEKMNGYLIDGKKLVVRIAGAIPPLNASLPNYTELASVLPSSYNASVPDYFPPLNEQWSNFPQFPTFPQKLSEQNCWPGPPGSMISELGISFVECGHNSAVYPGNRDLESPPPSLNAILPTNSRFVDIQREGFKLNCWPGPSCSILPETGPYYPKNGFNIESAPPRSTRYMGSTNQASVSSSVDLTHFPGYLKSFNSSEQLNQSLPSSSLFSLAPYRFPDFSSDHFGSFSRQL